MKFVAASPRLPLKLLRTSRCLRPGTIGKRSIIISSEGVAREKIAKFPLPRIYSFPTNSRKSLPNFDNLFPLCSFFYPQNKNSIAKLQLLPPLIFLLARSNISAAIKLLVQNSRNKMNAKPVTALFFSLIPLTNVADSIWEIYWGEFDTARHG